MFQRLASFFYGSSDRKAEPNQPSTPAEQAPDPDAWVNQIVWRDANDNENPFGHEVLDCRSVALGMIATTSDKNVAESFNRLRFDDGRQCIGTLPDDSYSVESNLRFPFNGNRDEGVIFAAKEMEDKWDFYAYESRLYLRRSWTGDLLHVAELHYTNSEVIVEKIHSNRSAVFEDPSFAIAHLRFLIFTHLGQVLMPFPIPPGFPKSERKAIALMGFSSYGRRAQFGELHEK